MYSQIDLVTVEYMKDGPTSDEIFCRLEAIEVGKDSDGDPITSCIVVPVEGAPTSAKKANAPKLTKGAKIALTALHEAIDECGEVHPPRPSPSIAKIKAAALQCRVLATPPQFSRVLRSIMARRRLPL